MDQGAVGLHPKGMIYLTPRVDVIRRYTDGPTLGILRVWEGPMKMLELKTLELPWKNNARAISCIPEGTYTMRWTPSPKFKATWQLMDVPGRKYIRIHAGNYLSDIQGCILVGYSHTDLNGDGVADIASSRKALKQLEAALPNERDVTITIR